MNLTDILPIEKWRELENDIHNRSGLDAYVYNAEGLSFTGFKKWANKLCPAIKASGKGLAFICAVANKNLANEAFRKKGPVIGECDAGLVKVAVPIFMGDTFLGVVGGCGRILDHSEVESFLIHKMADIDLEKIESLSSDIPRMEVSEAELLAGYIQEQINKIIANFNRARR